MESDNFQIVEDSINAEFGGGINVNTIDQVATSSTSSMSWIEKMVLFVSDNPVITAIVIVALLLMMALLVAVLYRRHTSNSIKDF